MIRFSLVITFADRLIEVALKAQIAVGEDADQLLAARDGQAGNFVLVHDVERLADGELGRDGDRVDDHAAFRALHAVDFLGLAVDGHVAVNEADAALARDGDGQARVGDGVHGGGHDGNVQRDLARKAGARVGFRRQHRRFPRQKQDVVKRQPLGDGSVNHCFSWSYDCTETTKPSKVRWAAEEFNFRKRLAMNCRHFRRIGR